MKNGKQVASKKSESKEAYRLWFQFLKRAIADESVVVNEEIYASWGDVSTYTFGKWWREVGSDAVALNARSRVSLASKGQAIQDDQLLISVPKSLTSTEAGNQLREVLMAMGHKPTGAATLSITAGAELRLPIVRAWLHTYDCNLALLAEQRRLGNKPKAVAGKVLLAALRKFYLDHQERYKRSTSKIDRVPFALFSDVADLTIDPDLMKPDDEARAIQAARRYLKSAEEVIASVAVGKFPN
jgi:hypothetical protein